MTWIEWVEPFNPDGDPVYMRVEKHVAIKQQRLAAEKKNHIYASDEQALSDFIAVNWATITDSH